MDFADFLSFSWRNIKNNSLRTWLTMIGIFIGIATIVSLISLGQGMQDAITERFSSLGADKIIFQSQQAFTGPPGTLAVRKLNDHDLNLMEDTRGFDIVFGRLLRQEKIKFKKKTVFAPLISMPDKNDQLDMAYEALNIKIGKGRLLKTTDSGKVLIGFDFGSKKIFDRTLRQGDKVTIKDKTFEIVGIIKRLGSGFGERFILMPQDDMKELIGVEDEWDAIIGQVKPGLDPIAVGEDLRRKVRRDRDQKTWEEDFAIRTPQEIIESFGNVLLVVQAVLVGIAGISLVVGGIGIMNTMYTAVLERTRQIGIIKSIGARNGTVMMIFLVESGLLGFVGGLIGVLLGMFFSLSVEALGAFYFGSSLINAAFPPSLLIGALLFSFIVGSFAGTLPAIQASRLKPVDALRYRKWLTTITTKLTNTTTKLASYREANY